MKRLFILLAVVLAASASMSAEERTKTYRFSRIERIDAAYNYRIYVSEDGPAGVKVVYDSELEDYMQIGYSASVAKLVLRMDELPRRLRNGNISPVKVYCSADRLEEIDLSGASAIYFEGNHKASDLKVELSGASAIHGLNVKGRSLSVDCSGAASMSLDGHFEDDVEMDLSGAANVDFNGKGHRMEVELSGAASLDGVIFFKSSSFECSGASDLDIEGEGDDLEIDGSGACKIDARSFKAKNAVLELSGACGAKIYASEKLSYDISRTCRMTYYGPAQLFNMSEDTNVIKGQE